MHIRCKSCHGAVWVEFPKEKDRAVLACCKTCGQEYHMAAGRGPAGVSRALAREARQLAEERGIDLPAAYSILLGTMTVEDVERVSAAPAPVAAGARTAEATHGTHEEEVRYDPAFEDAVRGGLLTPCEAIQRGRRSTYAELLAKRYRLSIETAYEVADNRISLLGAIRRNPSSEPFPLELSFKKRSAQALYAALAGTALLGILGMIFRPAARRRS